MSPLLRASFLLLALAVLAIVLTPGQVVTATHPLSVPTQPNIILILTDDLDASAIDFMPHLQELVIDHGETFSNFFVNVPLCCPSRASILRGQYQGNTKIVANLPPNGGFQKFYDRHKEQDTIATKLHFGGYLTALIGKYLNGYPGTAGSTYIPPGWDEWYSPVSGTPYNEFGYTLNENGNLVSYHYKPSDYETDVYAQKAVTFLIRARQENKPFFLYLAPYAPHQPATPAPRDAKLFPGVQAPRTPNFDEADVSDKPAYIRLRPRFNALSLEQIDNVYRHRLQSLQAVDQMILTLVDTLQANGQLDNTYLFFTSDNGFHLGNHRMKFGKQSPYEEDMRVPFVVRGPSVPAACQVTQLTGNIDLAPTFAELAGLRSATFVDGRSLVPLLHDPQSVTSWRQSFLFARDDPLHPTVRARLAPAAADGTLEPPDDPEEELSDSPSLTIPPFRALRTRDYVYIEYLTGPRELYDLRTDPYELNNLIKNVDPQLLAQMSAQLHLLDKCAGRTCRTIDGTAVPQLPQ